MLSSQLFLKRAATAILVLAAGTPATTAQEASPKESPVYDHGAWSRILKEVVHGDRVDYAAVRDKHLEALEGYLNGLAEFDPGTLSRDEQLAFCLNLYNATVVRAIVDRYKPGYRVDEEDFKLFKEPLVRVVGKKQSLTELFNDTLRARFKDPRIHVAVANGARSCPPLLDRAYEGDSISATLETRMIRFVEDPWRNQINHYTREMRLSQVFHWYATDFGGLNKVSGYVSRYLREELRPYKLGFAEYSWELNDYRSTPDQSREGESPKRP